MPSFDFHSQSAPQAGSIPQWKSDLGLQAAYFQPTSAGGLGAGGGNGGGLGWFYPGGVLPTQTGNIVIDESGSSLNGWYYPLDDTSGNLTQTLQAVATVPGKVVTFEKVAATGNTCTITSNGTEPIGVIGSPTTFVLKNLGDRVTLISTGVTASGWRILSQFRGYSGLLFSNIAASSAVLGSTGGATSGTGAAFDQSYTLPANTAKAGDRLRIKFQGTPSSGNSNDTLTITLAIGGTTIVATAAFDVTNGGGDIFYGEVELTIRTIGSSGTFVASGIQGIGVPGTVTGKPWFLGSTAINTTTTQAITVNALWGSSSASNSARLDMLTVERIPA